MGKPIETGPDQGLAAALRVPASSTRGGRVVRRVLVIVLVAEDHSRAEAARLNGTDHQTLRDRVYHDNDEGVAGLHQRAVQGRPGSLTEAKVRSMVLEGPAPDLEGVVRGRRVGLRDACDGCSLVRDAARAPDGAVAAPA